ncbi:hypothetical protein G6F50_016610 [Rhizopus delemar]|uniref:Uncharacterized protein n=1 Tax=Rhizopus delemar TaxID=936053 RepID=A0A9P6XSQ1_9FUNG|nr:hypothetical protein G6F50_016610 [Rhizopus delemar]
MRKPTACTLRTEPQPGQLVPGRRAVGVRTEQPGAGHRPVAGQDAAGAPVRLFRCAALPPGRQSPPDPGERCALPGAQQPPRWCDARGRQLRRPAALRAEQLRPVAGAAGVPRAADEDPRRCRLLELP